jgi:hypothetical protein
MKFHFLRLIAIAGLLLIGNVVYAGNSEQDASKVTVNKLKSDDATPREPGGLATRKAQPYTDNGSSNADKKRIQELEDLVREQQKLIELYKKQAKQP